MKTSSFIPISVLILTIIMITSCSTIPKGVTAVSPFEKEKYLGKWYEIARLDFVFEKDLNNTTAEYTLNDNGSIKVLNRGYNVKKKEWKESIGKAKFINDEKVAMLKVSFFGPFYAGYNVIAIDSEYQYALVSGKNLKYLWILSRNTTIPNSIKEKYLSLAKSKGFETSKLIWVEHSAK